MFGLELILSLTPLVLFLLLLFGKKTSLLTAAGAALIATAVLTIGFWQILPVYFFNSLIKGFLVAFDIFLIIFGAIFFLEILKEIKVIESLGYYLESFSKDYRVQVILLAWFLESFLEGTAGFGTPAVIVAPLLISLGLSPLTAVVIALLGNSTAGVFGAAGTPIRVGLAGLETGSLPLLAAKINLIGFLVPVFMLWTLSREQTERAKHFWEALPFALWSGIVFVVPSLLIVSLGQEFPSIIGSVIGMLLILLTTRLGLFLPKNLRTLRPAEKPSRLLSLAKVFLPYGLLVTLLILGKFFLGSFFILLPSGIQHSFNLFNPGFAFFIAAVPVILSFKKPQGLPLEKIKKAFKGAFAPFLVIVCMSVMVQLMINSGYNSSGLPSTLALIAKNLETPLLPFLAPVVGAFGAFITGSVTISNLMFGNFLAFASQALGLPTSPILALSLVGAAAGNMIALADILAAEAVVGLRHQERQVLKGVILPCVIYVFLTGLIGILFISYF